MINITFSKCDNLRRDWIGLYKDQKFHEFFFEEEFLDEDSEAWQRTCGTRTCTEFPMEGTVSFPMDDLGKGEFRVYLVRRNQAYATSEAFAVDKKCE